MYISIISKTCTRYCNNKNTYFCKIYIAFNNSLTPPLGSLHVSMDIGFLISSKGTTGTTTRSNAWSVIKGLLVSLEIFVGFTYL